MAEAKKEWSHTSTPPYVIMAWTGSTLLSYFKQIHTRMMMMVMMMMMMIEVVVVVALFLPLNKRRGRPQSESACFGENKNLLLLPEIKS
jgi:uncharacterized membrane protein affecting hemolysin expression